MLGRPGVVNRWRATSRGPAGESACTITSSSPSERAQTRSSTSALGTEYSAPPTLIVDCQDTLRVWPKQTVVATAGNRRDPLARVPEATVGRPRRQRVQPRSLLAQHPRRRPPRDPVLPRVD